MEQKKMLYTPDGYKELIDELNYLKTTRREEIKEQISEYEAANEDLTRILDSGDTDLYMEKLAREEYGYAYPDEFRFYDTSRN